MIGIPSLRDLGKHDASPSSAIAHAEWNAENQIVTITFRRGGSYAYPCDYATWAAYRAAESKGDFFNYVFAGEG